MTWALLGLVGLASRVPKKSAPPAATEAPPPPPPVPEPAPTV